MKKFLVVILAMALALTAVGCQSGISIARGTIEGDVYKNDVLGFEFTKPSDWKYYTDEEIAETINISKDLLNKKDLQKALEANPNVFDMMVADTQTGTNLNIGYEKLPSTFPKTDDGVVESYIDVLKEQLASVSSMKVTFPDEYDKAVLGESEFTKVVCKTVSSGIEMTQVFYLKEIPGHIAFIIVTVPGKYSPYSVSHIEKMFK